MDTTTLNNYKIIEKIVSENFALTDESKQVFKENLHKPQIDEVYSNIINSEDLRLRIPLEANSLEYFDPGWRDFKETFRYFAIDKEIEYVDFIRGTIMIGKNMIKLSKLIAEYYYKNLTKFEDSIFPQLDYYINNDQSIRNDIKGFVSKITGGYYRTASGNKFSNKSSNYTIVLSLNFADWFLCSTNESWTSCLNLESEFGGAYWSGLPGTIIDKNRALLYFTNGIKKDYHGIKVDKFNRRSWVILDKEDIFHVVRFFPSKIDIGLINKIIDGEWKYLPNEGDNSFCSKHDLNPLRFETGDSCFIYQDNTNLEKMSNSKYYFTGEPGGGGYYHLNKDNHIECGEIFSYQSGLSFLMDNRKLSDYFSYKGVTCNGCDVRIISEDYICYYNDTPYCNSCYDRYFAICPKCDETVDVDNLYIVEVYGNHISICENCYREEYNQCGCCYESFKKEKVTELNDYFYCDACYTRYVKECANCKTKVIRNQLYEDGDDLICKKCFYKKSENE